MEWRGRTVVKARGYTYRVRYLVAFKLLVTLLRGRVCSPVEGLMMFV